MNTCYFAYWRGTVGASMASREPEETDVRSVRALHVQDEAAAAACDRLVAETVQAIKDGEPGALVYAAHLVDGQPLQRIFYELYRDKAAFEAHEAAPHTRRYLDERGQYLASTEVDRLTLQASKGTGG